MSAMDLVLMNRQLTDNPLYVYNSNGDRMDLSSQPYIECPNFMDTVRSDLLQRKGKDYSRYMYNGVKVPRVTSILDYCEGNIESLLRWASKLGHVYVGEKSRILNSGTKVHEVIAEYLTSGTTYSLNNVRKEYREDVNTSFKNFMAWYNRVTIDLGWKVELFISEVPLICPWFGGTVDAILIINGRRFLVDFKSSKRIDNKYFIQTAVYKWIIDNYYPDYGPIDGLGILRFDKKLDVYEDLFLEMSDPNDAAFIFHCQQVFGLAVNMFYSMEIINAEAAQIKENKKDVSNIGNISEDLKKVPIVNKRKKVKRK